MKLQIFNALGDEVATLVNSEQGAGKYQVQWDASQIAAGIYLYRITAGEFVATKKMLYIK